MSARIEWHGDDIAAAIGKASHTGNKLAAEHLLQVSSSRAPHEEGDLERSGEVTEDPGARSVAVSFDRPYAVVQHEDLTLRHDSGRTAKYLEGPMNSERAIMLQLVATAAGRGLK